ncbi:hypothetical protein LX36DRAFT_298857 [Colletotrichum falcatum]|nr:hypothetical protein LX36DRAFT_298857 [Colletotrichum falcatum]
MPCRSPVPSIHQRPARGTRGMYCRYLVVGSSPNMDRTGNDNDGVRHSTRPTDRMCRCCVITARDERGQRRFPKRRGHHQKTTVGFSEAPRRGRSIGPGVFWDPRGGIGPSSSKNVICRTRRSDPMVGLWGRMVPKLQQNRPDNQLCSTAESYQRPGNAVEEK